MEDFTTQDLIEELQKHHPKLETRVEGKGITRREWMEANGISERMATAQLEDMVKEGRLEKRMQKTNTHGTGWVYYWIE